SPAAANATAASSARVKPIGLWVVASMPARSHERVGANGHPLASAAIGVKYEAFIRPWATRNRPRSVRIPTSLAESSRVGGSVGGARRSLHDRREGTKPTGL